MTSTAFLEETWPIGLRCTRSEPLCIVELLPAEGGSEPETPSWAKLCPQLKMRQVDIPGLVGRPCWSNEECESKVFSYGGLVGVAVLVPVPAEEEYDLWEMQCWVLNPANQSWWEVPPLPVRSNDNWGWNMWLLVGQPELQLQGSSSSREFQLFLVLDGAVRDPTSYSYCSRAARWRAVNDHPARQINLASEYCGLSSKGGYLFMDAFKENRVWRCCHDELELGTSIIGPVAEPPLDFRETRPQGKPMVLSHPDFSLDLVLGCMKVSKPPPGALSSMSSLALLLYRWDESCESQWRCVHSASSAQLQLPQGLHENEVLGVGTEKAQIVGHVVLIVVKICRKMGVWQYWSRHTLAYHILTGACKWLPLPPSVLPFQVLIQDKEDEEAQS